MKTFTYDKTSHPDLFRVVNREHEWTHYVLKPGTGDERFLPGITFTNAMGFAKGKGFYIAIKNASAEEWDRKFKAAGERGDRVHQFIARILSGEKLDRWSPVKDDEGKGVILADDEWDAILAFQEFWSRHEAALILHEQSVYHPTLAGGFAGTFDVILVLRKDCGNRYCGCTPFIGKVGLLDWKSGGGIYPDYGAQTAACAAGVRFLGLIAPLRVEYTGIVRIGTDHKSTGGYEFKTYDGPTTLLNFRQFEAAAVIRDAHVKPFDPAKEIAEVPDTLTMTVEKYAPAKPEAAAVPPKAAKRAAPPKATRKPAKGAKVAKNKPTAKK